jgi:hypothetical protein
MVSSHSLSLLALNLKLLLHDVALRQGSQRRTSTPGIGSRASATIG